MRQLALLILALATTPAALAGECRTALRPLLLSTQPEATALQAVRALCQKEADAGDPVAGYELALFHLGLGGEWQPQAAIPLMRDAATAGVSEAQYWLAWQYEEGPLLDHDPALALSWYQRAANANHRLAVARLARAYEAGELGLARNPLKAAEYKAREAQCLRRQQAGLAPQAAPGS
ncbi:MAG: hypothetical protein U1F72_04000 [Gammaproteobacteria bacterium]